MIYRDECQLEKFGVRVKSLRHVSKPKIDRLAHADPETDNCAEQFDRFQVMLRDHQHKLL
jgi:hypothetical protein